MQFQAQAAVQAGLAGLAASLIQQLLLNADDKRGGESPDERRCGWFDSSYELSAGLEVIEESKGFCFAD